MRDLKYQQDSFATVGHEAAAGDHTTLMSKLLNKLEG
jgi:hypothetical protein